MHYMERHGSKRSHPEELVPGTVRVISVRMDYLPTAADQQARCTPIYEEMPGWSESTEGARSWAELPANAIKYVRRVEELIDCPVALLSTSPEREDTILVRDPFAD